MKLLPLTFFIFSFLSAESYDPEHPAYHIADDEKRPPYFVGAYISFEANWTRCKEKKDRFACAEVRAEALGLWLKLCRKGPVVRHLRDEDKICAMAEEAVLMFLLKPKSDLKDDADASKNL